MSIIEMQRCDQKRARTVSLVSNLAERIVTQSGEELRRLIFASPAMTYGEIAQVLIPDECDRKLSVAKSAIRTAARMILNVSEQRNIRERNMLITTKKLNVACGRTEWSPDETDEMRRLLNVEIFLPIMDMQEVPVSKTLREFSIHLTTTILKFVLQALAELSQMRTRRNMHLNFMC